MIQAGQEHSETIIFLHGVVGNHRIFKREFEALSHSYHVICYDYLGYGGELLGKDVEHSMDILCEQLLEVFAEAGIERAHLCSLSYGSYIANYFAASYPDHVLSITHIGGYYNNPSRFEEGLLSLSTCDDIDYKEWIRSYASFVNPYVAEVPKSSTDIGRQICFDCAMLLHPNVFKKTMDVQLYFDIKSFLCLIKQPVLWIMGSGDHLYKSTLYDLKEMIPHVQYVEIPDACHVAHVDQPERFLSLFKEFLINLNKTKSLS